MPLLLIESEDSPDEADAPQAAPVACGKGALGRLLSVTWLPLLGLAAYVFMTGLVAHGAFGTMPATYLGSLPEAALVLLVCARWGRRPLLPWCYRVLVPLLAAVFVVLGAFPAGTFPQEASVTVLYGFYLVLAMIGCALFLAVTHSRAVAPELTCSFATAVTAAAALGAEGAAGGEGASAGCAPAPAADGARVPARVADGVPAPKAVGAAGFEAVAAASPATPTAPEPSLRDTLEARCAEVSAARSLSPREAEVLVYLARGFTPAYIAKSLVLSISTVRTHVRNIYRKLGVGKREELIHLIDGE